MYHKSLVLLLVIVILACIAVLYQTRETFKSMGYRDRVRKVLNNHLPKLYDRCTKRKRTLSVFDIGAYNLASLRGLGFFDVASGVACIYVPKGFTVTLFTRDWFQGRRTVLKEGTHSLFNDDSNLLAMSMVVESMPQFFSKCSWRNIEYALHPGWHDKHSLPNAKVLIRSMIIPRGYKVSLVYERRRSRWSRRKRDKDEVYDQTYTFKGHSAVACLNHTIPNLQSLKGINIQRF